jgi:hypothetical protein
VHFAHDIHFLIRGYVKDLMRVTITGSGLDLQPAYGPPPVREYMLELDARTRVYQLVRIVIIFLFCVIASLPCESSCMW